MVQEAVSYALFEGKVLMMGDSNNGQGIPATEWRKTDKHRRKFFVSMKTYIPVLK